MSTTDTPREIGLPYVPSGPQPTHAPKGFFSARYVGATSVATDPSELDVLRNGPIVLGDEAAARLREVVARGRKPLPAPAATRSDALQAR